MSWAGFIGIFALFFASHSVPVRPAVKSRIVAQIGSRGFSIGYSILSLAMLTLLIRAASQAPYVELWHHLGWQRRAVQLGMLAVCLILAFSIGRPNPFSFGGARNDKFDPKHPGFVRPLRHPVLVALALWAFVHILPNGDLAHVLMFSVLGGFAIAGCGLINRRKRREMGGQHWDHLNTAVAQAPLLSKPQNWSGTVFRLALGLGVFLALLALHPIVIGVSAI